MVANGHVRRVENAAAEQGAGAFLEVTDDGRRFLADAGAAVAAVEARLTRPRPGRAARRCRPASRLRRVAQPGALADLILPASSRRGKLLAAR